MIVSTSVRLADGRRLIYYDEADRGDRNTPDMRPAVTRSHMPELRHDRILDEWVAVASHRQTRTFLPPSAECPLCPSTPGHPTEIPAADYDVVVFENRFPTFVDGSDGPGGSVHAADITSELRRPAIGRCEVVCFTSDHGASFVTLSPMRVETIMEALAERTAALSALPGVEQVFPFENRGEEIGVTLAHPHGQIYAYPFVTPRTRQMLDTVRRHRAATGENLFGAVLAAEMAGPRLVAESEHWAAFVPVAARWPLEVHLYPLRQVADLTGLEMPERKDFAALYLDVLRRLDRYHGSPLPYIAAWHQAPVRVDRDLAWLHLEVFSCRRAPGRIKYLAGSESGMGVFINDVAPEEAADRLRGLGG